MSPSSPAPLLLLALLAWSLGVAAGGASQTEALTLEINGEGVAVARADLILPGPADLARRLLADPANWPSLFPSPVRIQSVIRHEHSAVTDMLLSPSVLLGDLRLVVETREVTPLLLETGLIRGDVRQYAHVWHFTPLVGEHCTRAILDLTMQLKTWMPTWLLRWMVQRELEGHFARIVAELRRRSGVADDCVTRRSPGSVGPVDSQHPLP